MPVRHPYDGDILDGRSDAIGDYGTSPSGIISIAWNPEHKLVINKTEEAFIIIKTNLLFR